MPARVHLGIDLGTTTTIGAYRVSGNVTTDPGPHLVQVRQLGADRLPVTETCLPSVTVVAKRTAYVGRYARTLITRGRSHDELQVKSVKRQMGTRSHYTLGDLTLYPEQVSSLYLRAIRSSVIRQLVDTEVCSDTREAEQSVRSVVITVPAAFEGPEREATRQAALLAGFMDVQLIDEPTAALIYYVRTFEGVGDASLRFTQHPATCLVYDLGGGTLDVSVCQVSRDEEDRLHITVLGRSPREDLGGDDFDLAIARELFHDCCENWGLNSLKSLEPGASAKVASVLLGMAEGLKIQMNTKYTQQLERGKDESWLAAQSVLVPEREVAPRRFTPSGHRFTVPRFLQTVLPLLSPQDSPEKKSILRPLQQALADANVEAGQVDYVFLAGASTRLVLVEEAVRAYIGIEPKRVFRSDLQNAVARGAAYYGEMTDPMSEARKPVFTDKLSVGLYIQNPNTDEFQALIDQNATVGDTQETTYVATETRASLRVLLFQGQNATDATYLFPVPWRCSNGSSSPNLELREALVAGATWKISATLCDNHRLQVHCLLPYQDFHLEIGEANEIETSASHMLALALPLGDD